MKAINKFGEGVFALFMLLGAAACSQNDEVPVKDQDTRYIKAIIENTGGGTYCGGYYRTNCEV